VINTKAFWLSTAIRAGRTFITVFASSFISFNQLGTAPYLQSASVAALAAILAVVTALGGIPEADGRVIPKWLAVLQRTIRTFGQTLAAAIPVHVIYLEHVNWLEVFQVSMTAAVGSLMYGLLSVLPEETPAGSLPKEA
jgi:Putative lactococcus lactis phage r1t holin